MKVVFLGDSISTQEAGIHYYGLQLIKRIVNHYPHHTYSVIATSQIKELSIIQKIVPVNSMIPGHLRWRQIFVLPRLIRKMQPDLVVELAHFGPFNLDSQVRRLTVVHDLTPILFPEFHPYLSVLMHRILFPRIVRKADYLIANSNRTKRDVTKFLDVDPETIYVVEPRIEDFLPEVPKDTEGEEYFLTVGTREPRKNLIVILRAFELFCEGHPQGRWVLVGKKGWRNEVFEKALQSSPVRNRIEVMGFVDRESLLRLYRGAFAFIQGSLYEGFGIPLIEAQAFGLPLLVARNPSIPDLVANSSILFDPESAGDLLEHMEELYRDHGLWNRMSEMSAQAFEQHQAKPLELDGIFGSDGTT